MNALWWYIVTSIITPRGDSVTPSQLKSQRAEFKQKKKK